MPQKCENPSREGLRLSENYENDTQQFSTDDVETVGTDCELVRLAARQAESQGADLHGFSVDSDPGVARAVARPAAMQPLEHISVELARVVAEIIVVGSGGFCGEVKPCQSWASRQLDRANSRQDA